ncbi:peptidase [Sphingobium quisquiliarum P25]|uniref:Peptidase n=1 Tax=Sphingobium quisquiliarum P25 TaxID=1329909 RepID=T0HGF6_9SPHN|nr:MULTISPECIES: peptidase [Sphingobium]EQB12102.1 peptidase [Sphingobium quisquiliarum P25]EZP68342.1 Peptidase [Sphingomonas paucimobilis]
MTYCVAVRVDQGLVMLSDTRTNAGMDNIARFRKSFTYSITGERAITLMCSGNLSITQGVKAKLGRAIKDSQLDPDIESILNCPTMHRVAQLVGDAMCDMQNHYRSTIEMQGSGADASILVAGQRKGGKPRLYLVYSAGNFIEATEDTPFFQIGEHKYGKPILDRIIKRDTTLEDATKAVLVSMDSTLRSNLSVGMPLDLTVIERDKFDFKVRRRIEADNEEFQLLSLGWSAALRKGFEDLPNVLD